MVKATAVGNSELRNKRDDAVLAEDDVSNDKNVVAGAEQGYGNVGHEPKKPSLLQGKAVGDGEREEPDKKSGKDVSRHSNKRYRTNFLRKKRTAYIREQDMIKKGFER